jgi:hypothetical protein
MKRPMILPLIALLTLGIAMTGWSEPALDLTGWFAENETVCRTVSNGSWSSDPRDAPSDAELGKILDFACKTQTAVNWNEFFFIAVRDPAEQEAIIGGATWKGSTSPGTVTVLILADQVADQANHKDKYDAKKIFMQTTMSYFDSGMACGFLNLAAYGLGYSTHYFASANGKTITPKDKTTYGIGSYNTPNWDISRFLKGKHYVRGWGFPDPQVNFDVEGNCVMIAAVVIGKANPAIDAVTAATKHGRPSNWAIWEPDSDTPPLK